MYQLISSFRLKTKVPLVSWLHIGLAGSFCTLLVGWWVVARVGCSIDRAYTLCAIQIGWQKLTRLLVVRLGAFLGHAALFQAQLIFYLKILLSWSSPL